MDNLGTFLIKVGQILFYSYSKAPKNHFWVLKSLFPHKIFGCTIRAKLHMLWNWANGCFDLSTNTRLILSTIGLRDLVDLNRCDAGA